MPTGNRGRWLAQLTAIVLVLVTLLPTQAPPARAGSTTVSVKVATFLCDLAIQSPADLAAAGGVWEACRVAVRSSDYHAPPDGYTSNLVSSFFEYEMAVPGGSRRFSTASLDGGGSCDPGTLECTYGYGYAWDNVPTGRVQLEGTWGPAGYRPGAIFVTDGGEPPDTDESAVVDLTDGTVSFNSTAPNVYVQFVWFAGYQDVVGSPYLADVFWLAERGITRGCGAPGFRFCAKDPITRGQMAAFLVRALHLTEYPDADVFTDTDGHLFRGDINILAEAGIAAGCGGGRFCPDAPVTRAQMASFLVRALDLPHTSADFFTDDEESVHEGDINRLAASGIARGCADSLYCPDRPVTREQMAAFLHRALK